MLHTFYYDSLGAMLDAIEATPHAQDGTYRQCGAGTSTWNERTDFCGRPLAQMVADCRSLLPFAEAIGQVEALVEGLTPQLPPPRSVRRRRVRRNEGDSIDVDCVLAGNLDHAWLSTRRLLHDDPTSSTTLVLLTSYAGGTSQRAIQWSMTATLGLAWLLEQSGRRVAIAATDYTSYPTMHGTEYSSHTVILKAHEAPWSLQEAIVTTDKAFLRRLTFRLQEVLPNPPDSSYGQVPDASDMRAHIATCATAYGWRHWLIGAHPNHDRVQSEEQARTWITHQLAALEAVAA